LYVVEDIASTASCDCTFVSLDDKEDRSE
jgi:hypothetical protein